MRTDDAPEEQPADPEPEERARRDFLRRAGRYAALTPPTVTMLLTTSMNSEALAASGGRPATARGRGSRR
jgi:hypothetical protein